MQLFTRQQLLAKSQVFAEYIIRFQIKHFQFLNDASFEQERVSFETLMKKLTDAVKQAKELEKKPLKFLAGKDQFPFSTPLNKEIIDAPNYMSQYGMAGIIEELGFVYFAELRKYEEDNDLVEKHYHDNLLLLKTLLAHLDTQLLILSPFNNPWLKEMESDEEKEAYNESIEQGIAFWKPIMGLDFNGGIELEASDIMNVLPHLLPLTPDIYFHLLGYDAVFSICKHGNFHFAFYDEEKRKTIHDFFMSKKFSIVESCGVSARPGSLADQELTETIAKMIREEMDEEDDDDEEWNDLTT